jgi:hypothetical protein
MQWQNGVQVTEIQAARGDSDGFEGILGPRLEMTGPRLLSDYEQLGIT